MPRLNNTTYYQRHLELTKLYNYYPEMYRYLSPKQQQTLHQHYGTDRTLTKRELIAYRADLDTKYPSLGQQAGKVYTELHARPAPRCTPEFTAAMASKHASGTRGPLAVSAVMRAQPDVECLARAFLKLAKQERRKQQGEQDDPDLQPPSRQ